MIKLPKAFKDRFRLFLTGLGMGTADLIPGVSGGTIAFLAGIYEELLYSIKTVTGDVVRLLLRGKVIEALKLTPFKFLIPLGTGLLIAILTLSNILSLLLTEYPVYIWSFFFGLVLVSVFVVLKRIIKWDPSDKISFILSAVFAYLIVGLVPGQTPATLPFFFLSGMIAITAMILPGISGSFILLLLGKYQQVLYAVTGKDFLTLGVFFLGTIVGISLFARVLSWLFKNHHDISIAILSGFMLGSIRKIWPWQDVLKTEIDNHGNIVPIIVKNTLPPSIDLNFFSAILLMVLGGYLVYQLDKIHAIKSQTKDVGSKQFEKEHSEALKNQ